MADFTLKWNDQLAQITRRAAAKGLTRGMAVIQHVSMDNTPVDTGNLKASQTVVPATTNNLTAVLVTDVPYAVYVHERPARHTTGGMKFMENAVETAGDKAFGVLAAEIAGAL